MDVRISPSRIQGNITAQPSKSDAHRKLICAAFANGISHIDNVILSDDIAVTLGAIKAAGCNYNIAESPEYPDRNKIELRGTGGIAVKDRKIDCGESGSTLRFMSMVFAAAGGKTSLSGKGRLPVRPLKGAVEFFAEYGISYSFPGEGVYLPMDMEGELESGEYSIDSSVTSQYISGLLMALPAFKKSGTIHATGQYESRGYVDLTVSVLKKYGIKVYGSNPYIIPENKGLVSCDTAVEGDWSNSSYFLAMNAMGAEIRLNGLDNDSSQPDSAIIDIIDKIKKAEKPVIDVSEFPDIMPTAAVVAAISGKTVVITGGRRLRAKESDRISSVAKGLKALGIRSCEFDDGIEIYGKSSIAGGIVDASNDHRIAMSFASLCCIARQDIMIKGAHCVGKSYPAFFEDLKTLGGKIS